MAQPQWLEITIEGGQTELKSLLKAVAGTLIESFRMPGARTPARLATWIKNTPELNLNLSLVAEVFLQLLASGLSALALVWATVVLLGGFSIMLGTTDFWFITAIVFVQTARIVGYNSAPEAKFFVDVPAALSKEDITATNFVRLLTMAPTWIALTPVFLATACMSLSIVRLVGIARHGRFGGSTRSIDACSNSNMKPALNLFYALVLTQGTVFLLWFAVAVIRSRLAARLNWFYLRQHLSQSSRKQLIGRYVSSIMDTCIRKGVASTINTNLVSFAAELLLQSQHPSDHLDAVLVLYKLVVEDANRSDRAVMQICSSGNLQVCRQLLQMLRSKNDDLVGPKMKAYIAEIVAKLAHKLCLEDIPGAVHSISSLLNPHLMKETAPQPTDHFFGPQHYRSSPLFAHGLVILAELASDPENCTEIYNTMDLVPKIVAPVRKGLHMAMRDDATAVQIVRGSLRVVAKLTRGIGECNTKLCHDLMTEKYDRTADNILWILSNSGDQEMRMLAVEILSRLPFNLDDPRVLQFTANLRHLLLDAQDSPLRIEAGKALIVIARPGEFPPDIQQLVAIMNSNGNSKEYRAVTADILAQTCARSIADQAERQRLNSVTNSLSMILAAIIVTVPENTAVLDESNTQFVASFLGLAVQIRNKFVNAQAFANVVTGLPMGNRAFAETLKRIIEILKDRTDQVCLAIIKSATKLVTWMTVINTNMNYFWEVNIVKKLDDAVKAMAPLERYAVMTGGADENEDVTLQTLVETARNSLHPQQQQQQQQQQHHQQQQHQNRCDMAGGQ